MLTVKHIRLSGAEDIYPTPIVSYNPGNDPGNDPSPDAEPATVWIEPDRTGARHPLTGGTVFVMNEAGKTVARYDIGASMVPFDEIKAQFSPGISNNTMGSALANPDKPRVRFPLRAG